MNKVKNFIFNCWRVGVATFFIFIALIFLGGMADQSYRVARILMKLAFSTTFSSTYDTATPAGTDSPTEADDRMRETKAAVQERENVDHFWPLTGTEVSDADTGEHRKVLFHEPIDATPTVAESHGDLRIKDVTAKAELHWTDEEENELQITDVGTLNIVSADLLGTLANNTFFTAVDNAGTGTVDLIKANASDDAVIPDGSKTATATAPTDPCDIANKQYVDDKDVPVKAWVVFDGTDSGTITPGDSFNITSVVKTATGKYTITWDTNFASGNYVLSGMAISVSTNEAVYLNVKFGAVPQAGSAQIEVRTGSEILKDVEYVSIMAVGNQ